MPSASRVADLCKEISIQPLALLRVQVIRMRQHQRHAGTLLDEVQFVFPDARCCFAACDEEGVVLRQGIR